MQLLRLLPRPLISHTFLSKISPAFPRGSAVDERSKNKAQSAVAAAIQDLLAEEGEYLELLVQVLYLFEASRLNHLAKRLKRW